MKQKHLSFRISCLLFLWLPGTGVEANCELSWVKDWEKGQNWFHTNAVYPADLSSLQRKKIPDFRQVVYQLDKNILEIRCKGADQKTCRKIKMLRRDKKSCQVNPQAAGYIQGIEDEIGISLYARQQYSSCLDNSTESNIAILQQQSILSFPATYRMTESDKREALALFIENEKNIRTLPALKKLKFSQDFPAVNIVNSRFALDRVLQDSLGNLVVFFLANIRLDAGNNLQKSTSIALPVIAGKINNKWLIIGNGFTGQCSSYDENYQRDLLKGLQQPFGLPDNFILYDLDYDGQVDLLELRPRYHLPGTRYLYHLEGSRLVMIGELCTTAPQQCRPGAGC